jgi:hypothetical protein
MTTEDIIIHIFYYVDEQLKTQPQHHNACLHPSYVVTIGILFALKGGHFRAFYRWLKRDFAYLFGGLPDRTNLQRQLQRWQALTQAFLVTPTFFTVVDTFPVEVIFPVREGRSKQQVGKKSKDKGRWTVGVKLCWVLDTSGRVVAWAWQTLNVHDQTFHPLIAQHDEETITLGDLGFRCAAGTPKNLKLCPKGTWNERMVVETAFSLVTVVCDGKKIYHRLAAYIEAHFAYLAAMFNVLLALYHQVHPEAPAHKMSLAEFSL